VPLLGIGDARHLSLLVLGSASLPLPSPSQRQRREGRARPRAGAPIKRRGSLRTRSIQSRWGPAVG
jgi:hypothetical protein